MEKKTLANYELFRNTLLIKPIISGTKLDNSDLVKTDTGIILSEKDVKLMGSLTLLQAQIMKLGPLVTYPVAEGDIVWISPSKNLIEYQPDLILGKGEDYFIISELSLQLKEVNG